MKVIVVDECTVRVTGYDSISDEEAAAYVQHVRNKFDGEVRLDFVDLGFDGDFVDVQWKTAPAKFDRIRRITGYLVGTLDRFNDGKRSEEHDRVKHGIA